MAIEDIKLVDKKDTIGKGKGQTRHGHKHYTKGGGTHLKAIRSRDPDKKRCFICGGHDEGSWHEYFENGEWKYHFLCQKCMKSRKGRYGEDIEKQQMLSKERKINKRGKYGQ